MAVTKKPGRRIPARKVSAKKSPAKKSTKKASKKKAAKKSTPRKRRKPIAQQGSADSSERKKGKPRGRVGKTPSKVKKEKELLPKEEQTDSNPRRQSLNPRVKSNGEPKVNGKRDGRPDMRRDVKLVEDLLNYIRAGNTFQNACDLVGIHLTTFTRWMKEGQEALPGSVAYEFYIKTKEAKAVAEHRNIMVIQKHQPGWQASAWFLERRNPSRWGRVDTIRTGKEEDLQDEENRAHTEEELLSVLRRVRRRLPDTLGGER